MKVSGRLADAAGEDASRTARSGRTSSTTSPTGSAHYETHRPGDLGADRRQGRRLHLRGRHRRHARRRRHGAARSATRRSRSASPTRWAPRSISYYTTGELKAEGTSITEGIGQGRITANLEGAPVDDAYQIPDEEAVQIVFDLLEHEGLVPRRLDGHQHRRRDPAGQELGPGHTIVTMLCDYGTRYQSKLFNPEFLRAQQPARCRNGSSARRRSRCRSRRREPGYGRGALISRW